MTHPSATRRPDVIAIRFTNTSAVWAPTRGRLLMLVGAAAYTGALQWVYIALIAPIFGYLGFSYSWPGVGAWTCFSLVAIIPALWMPMRLSRPSQWLYLYVYLAVYIPTCFVPLFRAAYTSRAIGELVPLVAAMFLCIAGLGITYRLPLRSLHIRPLPRGVFWSLFVMILVAAYCVMYFGFGANLRFVGQDLVREQRLQGREVFQQSRFGVLLGYAIVWTGNALNPFLLAYGIRTRQIWFTVAAIAGQGFVYMTTAGRGVIVSILLIVTVAFLLRRCQAFGNRTVWVFVVVLFVVGTIANVCSASERLELAWASSRALATPGWITDVYYSFFSEHPFTGFSQIRGIGWFVDNPYQDQRIGFMIGDSLGQHGNHANANFLADGFACLGFFGMAIVTAVAILAFYLLDCASLDLDIKYIVLATAVQAMNLADVSIFSTMLGGGMLFLLLLLLLAPRLPGTMRSPRPNPQRTSYKLPNGRLAVQQIPYLVRVTHNKAL